MRRHTMVAVCLFAGWPAQAELVTLDNDSLKHAVAGKTVNLDTPVGIQVPVTYHGNGMMSGQAGVLSYVLGAEQDRGRWWVADGKLCQRWFKWLDAKAICMRIQQDGRKIVWRADDGNSGTATIASALAPGAESAPRGLGGPAHEAATERSRQSVTADEPLDKATPAPASAHPPVVRAVAKTVHKPVPTPVKVSRLQVLSADGPGLPIPTDEPRSWLNADDVTWAGPADRWCHAMLSESTEAVAAPDLVLIARLAYDEAELATPPTNACLSPEPALQNLARLGYETR